MDPSTLKEALRARLKKHEGHYPEISQLHAGLTYSWVCKFAHERANNPTVDNLQALKEALDAFEGAPQGVQLSELAEAATT